MPQLLIVESSSTEALRAQLILERAGHQVRLAANEPDALRLAAEQPLDLILLGTLAPRLNGYAACGKLKLDPKTRDIPVILLGAKEELDDLGDGAVKYFLTKPYDPQLLVSKVKETLNGHAKPESDAAQQARSHFLANISHELRTPLHEITGMTDLVLGTELTPEQRGYLDTLRGSSNALLSLIGDLIEFSELEAGQMDFDEKEFALAEPLERVAQVMRPRAADKGLAFSIAVPPDVPSALRGDATRLRQILMHLVANAIKFTERGEVVLTVTGRGGDEESGRGGDGESGRADAFLPLSHSPTPPLSTNELHFSVRDTGIGIPADRQRVIFEPFQQADTSATRRYGGTGMGLAIAKQLVERIGGRIWVESQAGQGSTFHFTIPLQAAQAAPVVAPKRAMSALRILVAEDSPTNQLIAKASLTKAGHTVTLAVNGLEAVKAYEATQDQPFDLVLMDVSMPEMDGLEATRQIRSKENGNGNHILIVAMTAFATKEYQVKCIQAGMDAYVSKPVRMDELKRVVEPLLVQQPKAATPQIAPVELSEALEVVGGDVDILRDAVAISLEEIPEQLEALEQAVARQDAHAVEAKAHRLKGILGNLGGMSARKIAQQLETMGERGELDSAEADYRALKTEIERVKTFYADAAWEAPARELAEMMNA